MRCRYRIVDYETAIFVNLMRLFNHFSSLLTPYTFQKIHVTITLIRIGGGVWCERITKNLCLRPGGGTMARQSFFGLFLGLDSPGLKRALWTERSYLYRPSYDEMSRDLVSYRYQVLY